MELHRKQLPKLLRNKNKKFKLDTKYITEQTNVINKQMSNNNIIINTYSIKQMINKCKQ